jgi:hypothetical protein
MMGTESADVECYSGATYAERPVAVHRQGQRLVVEQVLRSWRTPAGPGFEVTVAGQRRLRLQLDEAVGFWDVQEIAAGAIAPADLGHR